MLALGLVVGSSIAIAYAAGTIDLLGNVLVDGTLTIQDGTQGFGKVFTSDGIGQGSWQEAAADILNLNPTCPADKVQHWTLIVFVIKDLIAHNSLPDLEPFDPNFPGSFGNNPSFDSQGGFNHPNNFGQFLNPNIFELKLLQSNVGGVVLVQQKVVNALNTQGYFNGTVPSDQIYPTAIFIRDVDYSTICVE